MEIRTAASEHPDTDEALQDVLGQLRIADAGAPDFVAVHMSAAHRTAPVQAAFAKLGAGALHGGTSCLGVMTNAGFSAAEGFGLGAFAVWDGEGDYGSAVEALGDDARGAARKGILRALDAAGRSGEMPDLVWLTAVPGREEDIIAGIQDVLGNSVPIVGGSAADNTIDGDWFVFDEDSAEGSGLVVSVFFASRPISSAYQNGYAPTDIQGMVTRAKGRRLIEIDGRPAAEVYAEWIGQDVVPASDGEPVMILAESTLAPLGRRTGFVADVPFFLLAHPAYANPDGSIDLFAEIETGEEITLMTGAIESLTARAAKVAAMACKQGRLGSDDVAGALVVYCGGCMLAVREHMDRVARHLDAALGGAPFLGVFTFGEQGPVIDGRNRHGNLMISCVSFAR